MPLSAGTRLGHHDVGTLLGEGGMGQVWQATDTQLNRKVRALITDGRISFTVARVSATAPAGQPHGFVAEALANRVHRRVTPSFAFKE